MNIRDRKRRPRGGPNPGDEWRNWQRLRCVVAYITDTDDPHVGYTIPDRGPFVHIVPLEYWRENFTKENAR